MRGWILDLYPGAPGEMVVWLKLENGETARLVDRWAPSIFVGTDNRADFAVLVHTLQEDFQWTCMVHRRERVTDATTSEVLELKLKDATKAQHVAERIERLGPFGTFRLYNADIPPAQSYLYEKDLFPLAFCEVKQEAGRLNWNLMDSVWDYDYSLPPLRRVTLKVEVDKGARLPRATDIIGSITLESDNGVMEIDGQDETDKLRELMHTISDSDPDFILTRDGDTFLFPYLIGRVQANGLSPGLVMGRDRAVMKLPPKRGTSYLSYGRIRYKPSAIKLRGRVHIDVNTSFAYMEAGFDGLFELTRICRMPLHTSSRASIGRALSSLQFYHACKAGLLVPWKPTLAERFKDRNELLLADRGGFIFEPKTGVHENVGELDFSALYPSIMYWKNVSAETIRCSCCPDSDNRVPELGWNTCVRNQGIVPQAIKIIVTKRLEYATLRKNASTDGERKKYNNRQAALKWLGVTTFGYLGFNNAKFGRIDAHIAVCAWDRKVLLDATRVAEDQDFEVIHGIVDSLWVKREGARESDYASLGAEIEATTGFTTSFEGLYKWIVFLSSKSEPGKPVINCYFGARQDGTLKVRGIEARRHDTPRVFMRCQMEILGILAQRDTAAEARAMVPACAETFLRYAESLRRHEFPATELAFVTNLSKEPGEYMTSTVQSAAVRQLMREGASLHAGEGIRYVITDYRGRDPRRSIPLDMVEDQTKYDSDCYVRLLAETCSTVLEPFAPRYTAERLMKLYETRGSVFPN